VKSGENRNAASFKAYIKTRQPHRAIRFSKRGCRTDGGIINVPLYLARLLGRFV